MSRHYPPAHTKIVVLVVDVGDDPGRLFFSDKREVQWSKQLIQPDTSCILAWLIDEGYDVVAFMADVGQEEDFAAAEKKAMDCGAVGFFLEDLKKEFIEELIYRESTVASS